MQFFACVLVAAACSFAGPGVHGRTIQLDWTPEGVKNYTSNALRTDLGDVLELKCHENTSNLFIQMDRIQYDSCNASTGSGIFKYNGICYPRNPLIMLTLTENSQPLENTINFVNNQVYFLTSYSDGELRPYDEQHYFGGQCEDGLKMIITIGEIEVPTSGPGDNGGDQGTGPPVIPTQQGLNKSDEPTVNGLSLYVIIGIAVGALVAVGLIVVCIIIIIVACMKGRHSKGNSNISFPSASSTSHLFDSGLDSRNSTLKRTEFSTNLGSQPLDDINNQDSVYTQNDLDANPKTFSTKKNQGSLDYLCDTKPYKSAVTEGKRYDNATGQFSLTPSDMNITPEHMLKSKSTSELSSPPTHHTGKSKPIPPRKPQKKSLSLDKLLS